jgi:hypothetical protein
LCNSHREMRASGESRSRRSLRTRGRTDTRRPGGFRIAQGKQSSRSLEPTRLDVVRAGWPRGPQPGGERGRSRLPAGSARGHHRACVTDAERCYAFVDLVSSGQGSRLAPGAPPIATIPASVPRIWSTVTASFLSAVRLLPVGVADRGARAFGAYARRRRLTCSVHADAQASAEPAGVGGVGPHDRPVETATVHRDGDVELRRVAECASEPHPLHQVPATA